MSQQSPSARIIIDTDPGVDDVFAILAALSAKFQELEVLLISITHGNVDAQSCLKNTVTLFSVLAKERAWRLSQGRDEGFEAARVTKPIVALGAEEPLAAIKTMAEYYHGRDGLGGTHSSHPHIAPPEDWKTLFDATLRASEEVGHYSLHFRPSATPAHKEMLRLLKENPPNTITLVAIGPLTNLALAATEDQETFLRAKEVVIMGGVVEGSGNITPVAEFNTYADPHAADLIFSLTSPEIDPTTPLQVRLFPLDLTVPHLLRKSDILPRVDRLAEQGSPLAEWIQAILGHTYQRAESLANATAGDLGLSMHDPLCIWYVISQISSTGGWKFSAESPEDIRVETDGKWTRGMCVVDRRNRKREENDVPGDRDGWLNSLKGNRVWRVAKGPGTDVFPSWMVDRIFGS